MNSVFQPSLIEPSNTRNTGASATSVGLRILDRQGARYAEWLIGNETAKAMGLSAGDRVTFGLSQNRKAGAIAPNEAGWKLVRHGKYAISVQVKAVKLGLDDLPPQPPSALTFIHYDGALIVDLTPIHPVQ